MTSLYQHIMSLMRDKLQEEVPVNSAGTGNVAGIGVGTQGEPPGKVAVIKKFSMMKRKKPNVDVVA